jgi:hypothetical protein
MLLRSLAQAHQLLNDPKSYFGLCPRSEWAGGTLGVAEIKGRGVIKKAYILSLRFENLALRRCRSERGCELSLRILSYS